MKTRIKKNIDVSWMDAGVEDSPALFKPEPLDENETRYKPGSTAYHAKDKKLTFLEKKKIRIKTFAETIKALPQPGERLFIIGGGNIDAIHSIHVALDFIPCIEELYISTWSMTTDNVHDLFILFDTRRIKKMSILASLFFRGRYKTTYAALTEGMKKRGQMFVICENHSKIILIKAPGFNLVASGSANFTCNPRIEQLDLTNSEYLYNCIKNDLMDDILSRIYPEIKKKSENG